MKTLDNIIEDLYEVIDGETAELRDKIENLNRRIRDLEQERDSLMQDNVILKQISEGKEIKITGDSIKIGNTRYMNGTIL